MITIAFIPCTIFTVGIFPIDNMMKFRIPKKFPFRSHLLFILSDLIYYSFFQISSITHSFLSQQRRKAQVVMTHPATATYLRLHHVDESKNYYDIS